MLQNTSSSSSTYTPQHTPDCILISNELMMLHQPRTSPLWGNTRSFSVASAQVWNQLPLTVNSSPSITTFKTNLKSHLFKQAYSHNPAVLICLSLLKRHEHLPEADTNALLSVLYYYYLLIQCC